MCLRLEVYAIVSTMKPHLNKSWNLIICKEMFSKQNWYNKESGKIYRNAPQ